MCSAVAAVAITAVLICSLAAPAAAYPSLWTLMYASNAESCTSHPTSSHMEHGYQSDADRDTTFTILSASTGQAIPGGSMVCAGETYTIRVTFTKNSHYLLTASTGTFSRKCDSTCLNRVCPGSTSVVASNNLTLPCDATGAIELKVTHAEASNAALKTVTMTLQVDPKCQRPPSCGGTPPSTPSPSPDPKPPSPSPRPSPAPPTNALNLTLSRSNPGRPLSLARPNNTVTFKAMLRGPASRIGNKSLKITVPKVLDCTLNGTTVATNRRGEASVVCRPKAVGVGRFSVTYLRLSAGVSVRVIP